jgi:hypothetical protein
MPGQPKRFVALTIAIAAAALSAFNAYRITELNNEISALKSKTDLLVDISHLHEAHLHHLEEKTDATTNYWLLKSNVWFTTKITDAVEKKFQSMVLLEQYFKRHPTTKFNKTPSAKYILL